MYTVCYVSLCERLHAGAGSLCAVVHVDCSSLSTIVMKNVVFILLLCAAGWLFEQMFFLYASTY